MSAPPKKTLSESNIEESYNRHTPIAAKVQAAYEKAIAELFNDMSAECLEPFAAILLEHENTVMKKETIIESICCRMRDVLAKIYENFFVANNVGKKLITLEVLKERSEPYKGSNWNVHKLTPEEQTRPVRMRLINSSIRCIQRQLVTQEKALQVALAQSKENRERIQNMQNERVKLYALMQQQSGYYKEMTPKLMQILTTLIEKK